MAAKHEELPIPVYSTLEPVYGEGSQVEEAQLRFDKLEAKFTEVFGQSPDVFARSPGNSSCSDFDSGNCSRIILAFFVFGMISAENRGK